MTEEQTRELVKLIADTADEYYNNTSQAFAALQFINVIVARLAGQPGLVTEYGKMVSAAVRELGDITKDDFLWRAALLNVELAQPNA